MTKRAAVALVVLAALAPATARGTGAQPVRASRGMVVSQNFMEDTRCGENLLKQVSEMYRRVRNTFRFLVNNLYDFDPAAHSVPEPEMEDSLTTQPLNHRLKGLPRTLLKQPTQIQTAID